MSHLTSLEEVGPPPVILQSTVPVSETLQVLLLLLESVEGGGLVVTHYLVEMISSMVWV